MRALMLASTLLASLTTGAAIVPARDLDSTQAQFDKLAANELSVMSYNVEGLPWPIKSGRSDALEAIGKRLGDMRSNGVQPHIVMLQEAFTDQAKSIGALGGYRYSANGPSAEAPGKAPTSVAERRFAEKASFWSGETEGKWQDSGLRILSDYPIVKVKRMAFPTAACAGYDCLANKGVLIAWIKIPGIKEPVVFADTHLNSRKASGVGPDRADEAFAMQSEALRNFVASNVSDKQQEFVAGDFNVGKDAQRQQIVFGTGLFGNARELIEQAVEHRAFADADQAVTSALIKRHKDFLFSRDDPQRSLSLKAMTIPFGIENDGSSLSDHVGYTAHFRISDPKMTKVSSHGKASVRGFAA